MIQGKPAALVTGAATGIGRAAAVALAAAGYDVAINYSRSEAAARETAAQAQAKGAKTLLFQCDVSDDPAVRKMLKAVEQEFSRLDALVNNAGTTSNVRPADFEAMTAEEWDRVFAVNVRGMFQVTRAAAPLGCAVRIADGHANHRDWGVNAADGKHAGQFATGSNDDARADGLAKDAVG